MKKNKIIILLIFFSLQLLGCDSIKKGLGFKKDIPDEFLVEKRQNILLPPDYNLIPPNSKTEIKKVIKEQDLNYILNEELNKNTKSSIKINTEVNSQSNEIENKTLNNIK